MNPTFRRAEVMTVPFAKDGQARKPGGYPAAVSPQMSSR
jgi:hypothetical protein